MAKFRNLKPAASYSESVPKWQAEWFEGAATARNSVAVSRRTEAIESSTRARSGTAVVVSSWFESRGVQVDRWE